MKKNCLTNIICLLACCFIFMTQAYAHTETTDKNHLRQREIESLQAQLNLAKNKTAVLKKKLHSIAVESTIEGDKVPGTQTYLNKVRLELAIMQAERASLNQLLDELKEDIHHTTAALKKVTSNLQHQKVSLSEGAEKDSVLSQLEAKIDYLSSVVKLQNLRAEEYSTSERLSHDLITKLETQYELIYQKYQRNENEKREALLRKQINKNQVQRKIWLDKLARLTDELEQLSVSTSATPDKFINTQLRIFDAEERLSLFEIDIRIAKLTDKIDDLHRTLLSIQASHLNSAKKTANVLMVSVERLRNRIQSKLNVISQQETILARAHNQPNTDDPNFRGNQRILVAIQDAYNTRLLALIKLSDTLKHHNAELNKQLAQVIARRHGLPGFDLKAWSYLLVQLSYIPKLTFEYIDTLKNHVTLGITNMSHLAFTFGAVMWVVALLVFISIRRVIQELNAVIKEKREGVHIPLPHLILHLVNRHFILLSAGLFLFYFLYHLSIPTSSYRLLLYLFLTLLVYRGVMSIARVTLVENLSECSGSDILLYKRLRIALSVGFVVAILTVVTNELHMENEVRELFNRFFMLFLLIIAGVLFFARKLIPQLIESAIPGKHPYFFAVVRLLCNLIPLTLFFNAITGLLGYLDLAWTISFYQITLLFVAAVYVIVRGVFADLMEKVSRLCISHLRNGWLWSQAILRPLDKLFRLLLVITAGYFLFMLYGWNASSPVVQTLDRLIYFPMFNLFGSAISLFRIAVFILLMALVFWIANWSREFAYRWLYKNVADVGIRNSLSFFTQYLMVAIILLLSLQILGITLTTLSYVLGGLAVGLGFALRDLASNLISGLILLIERPVREGDLISIETHEGFVTRIGLRSMTVRSWDNLEVMIPNSNPFNKPFINWTHQDSIVRTVIPIKIHRLDDVNFVRDLLLEVLADCEEVLTDPEPSIFMKEIDDALIELEIRYFINLQEHVRMKTRSKVLFSVWACFKKHGIRPPYPQNDLHIVEGEI